MNSDLIQRAVDRLSKEGDAETGTGLLSPFGGGGAEAVAAHLDMPGTAPATYTAKPPVGQSLPQPKTTIDIDFARLRRHGMVTPDAHRTLIAEEYRMIKRQVMRTAQRIGEGAIANGNIMMVTSARPGEGKTFSSVNLAMSIAMERDMEVLLVDADATRGSVSTELGFDARPGLVEHLIGEQTRLEDILIGTNVPNLIVLPSGRAHPETPELFGSPQMIGFIRSLAGDPSRRIVIFDAPPALASSEAAVLAQHVGQVLVVVEAEKTNRRALDGALELLNSCANLSLLLNKARFSLGSQHFGAYYGTKG